MNMIFNHFRWYRRMIGGKWGRVTSPLLGGRKWVHVPDECGDRIDEHWVNLRTPTDDPVVSIRRLRENFAFQMGHTSAMWEKQDYRGTALIERILRLFDEAARDT